MWGCHVAVGKSSEVRHGRGLGEGRLAIESIAGSPLHTKVEEVPDAARMEARSKVWGLYTGLSWPG